MKMKQFLYISLMVLLFPAVSWGERPVPPICDYDFKTVNWVGLEEVGPTDGNIRSEANKEAAIINQGFAYDCNYQIDQCKHPSYWRTEDGKFVVIIGGLENTYFHMVFAENGVDLLAKANRSGCMWQK